MTNVVQSYILVSIGLLTLIYCVYEIYMAIKIQSLTLLSDGMHNLSDVAALVVAWYAAKAAKKPISSRFSYGMGRAELLGGQINGVALLSLCLYVLLEALSRLMQPALASQDEGQQFAGWQFITVAAIGLVVNTIGTGIAHHHGHSHSSSSEHHGHSHASGGHHSHSSGHSHASEPSIPLLDEDELAHQRVGHSHSHHNVSLSEGKEAACLDSDTSAAAALAAIASAADVASDGNGDGLHPPSPPSSSAVAIGTLSATASSMGLIEDDAAAKLPRPGSGKRAVRSRSRPVSPSGQWAHALKASTGVAGSCVCDCGGANLTGVFLHYLGDMLSSVFVLILGLILHSNPAARQWSVVADAVGSLFIILLILVTTLPMVRQLTYTLMQAVPRSVSLTRLSRALISVPGVTDVSDLHVWELTSGHLVGSATVSTDPRFLASTASGNAGTGSDQLNRLRILLTAVSNVFQSYGIKQVSIHPLL